MGARHGDPNADCTLCDHTFCPCGCVVCAMQRSVLEHRALAGEGLALCRCAQCIKRAKIHQLRAAMRKAQA